MDLNTERLLDISTGHLSTLTRSWLSAAAAANRPISVAEREEGWVVSATWGDTESHDVQLPADLLHVLAVAHAHDVSYVMFDTDAPRQEGLPYYADGIGPERGTDFAGEDALNVEHVTLPGSGAYIGAIMAVRPGSVDYLALAGKVATAPQEDPAP